MLPDALVLGLSALALLFSGLALTRSTPASLRSECEEARSRSLKACAEVEALRGAWEAARVEFTGMVEQLIEERERALKARQRAQAERTRAEQTGNGPTGPESKQARMNRLRRESGVLAGV